MLPGLNIASGPVVEHTESGDVIAGLGNRDGVAQFLPRSDPYSQFELIVEFGAKSKARRFLAGEPSLSLGTADRGAGNHDRGGPAVVSDRDVLIIRQQRCRPLMAQSPVVGMMDAGVEIAEAANGRRQVHSAIRRLVEQVRGVPLGIGGIPPAVDEQLPQPFAQGPARLFAQRHQRVDRGTRRGRRGYPGAAREETGIECGLKVKDVIANRHTSAWVPSSGTEDA